MSTTVRHALILAFCIGCFPALADDGAAVYTAHCALCHGNGPSPVFMLRSFDEVKAVVTQGKGKMPAVALTPADLDAVAKYTASSYKNQPWYAPSR